MKIGDVIKMSEDFKDFKKNKESKNHIKEFGNCIGIVEDLMYPDTDEFYNIRWYPSKLRYGYKDTEIEILNIKTVKYNNYLCKVLREWGGGYYDLETIENTYLETFNIGIVNYLSVNRLELLKEGNKNI